MKKLFILTLALLGHFTGFSQTATLVLTTPPCNNNGVVTSSFTGLTTPITVTYHFQGSSTAPLVHSGLMTTTDVLTGYSGVPFTLVAHGANNAYAYGNMSAPPFTFTLAVTGAICPALGTGTATVTGGTAPYTYAWNTIPTTTVVSTANPASLPGGHYSLTVTDANGCTYSHASNMGDSIVVSYTAPFTINASTTTANCTNGTATVTSVPGGTPPISYLWSNSATTSAITGLTKGYYSVTVTDLTGCSDTRNMYVQQSIQIGSNVVTTPATCLQNNGAVSAFGSGGTPPYTYLWSNTATTATQTGLTPGLYSVVTTDANGCTGNANANISSTTPITATYAAAASSCTSPTGSATLTVSGGATPYTITWNTLPVQTGVTASGLSEGTYGFKITDANGCVRNGSAVIPPMSVITGAFSSTQPTCTAANGSLGFSPAGGVAPYTYAWSNSGTTQNISGLAAGSYSVTVTDNIGCQIIRSAGLLPYSPVSIGLSTTPATCIFNSDGSIVATVVGGTAPYTYSWSNSSTTNTATGLATGHQYLHVTDAVGCTRNANTFVPYNAANNSCYCTIQGYVYNDVNNNCVKDAGEAGINNIQIHCSGIGYAYTNASGFYSFKVPTGSYTITQSILSFYPLAACQTNNIAVAAVASSGCTQTVNFGNNTATIHDMRISTWNYNCPVPGYPYKVKTIITNSGTVTEPLGMAGFASDAQLPAPTFSPGGMFVNGGTNWYKIASGALPLNAGISQAFLVNYTVPTNMPLSTSLVFKDTVSYTSPITNWTSDYSPWNNVNYYTPIVVGSYDPNFKEVSPKGTGTNGMITAKDSVLEYMVHFQNLGTYKAQNIFVLDTLDADLDWTTMRPVYQSHPCVVTMDDNGVAKFTFNNIDLPAQMHDDLGSNGMFTYTIKTKKNLPLGTEFTNSAAIYFDFNEPIITNTTLNTLGTTGDVPVLMNSDGNSFKVYPNPASNLCYVQVNIEGANTATALKVTDLTGKTLMSKNYTLSAGQQVIEVDATSFTPGVYFITLTRDGKSETQKIVIMK